LCKPILGQVNQKKLKELKKLKKLKEPKIIHPKENPSRDFGIHLSQSDIRKKILLIRVICVIRVPIP
jgi:hypothetical protein